MRAEEFLQASRHNRKEGTVFNCPPVTTVYSVSSPAIASRTAFKSFSALLSSPKGEPLFMLFKSIITHGN